MNRESRQSRLASPRRNHDFKSIKERPRNMLYFKYGFFYGGGEMLSKKKNRSPGCERSLNGKRAQRRPLQRGRRYSKKVTVKKMLCMRACRNSRKFAAALISVILSIVEKRLSHPNKLRCRCDDLSPQTVPLVSI